MNQFKIIIELNIIIYCLNQGVNFKLIQVFMTLYFKCQLQQRCLKLYTSLNFNVNQTMKKKIKSNFKKKKKITHIY